jgi:hypothetical protein
MKANECYLILLDKLNKLNTNFSQTLQPHNAVRAIREATYYWYDERLRLEEATKMRQQELQHLIVPDYMLDVFETTLKYVSYKKPNDLYFISNISCLGLYGTCKSRLNVHLIENSNLEVILLDDSSRPDFSWEQTVYVLKEDKIFIYKDKPTSGIGSAQIDYYRKPKEFDIVGYKHFSGIQSTDSDLDFNDSSAYEILDLAASIIAGNINDAGRTQHNKLLYTEFK